MNQINIILFIILTYFIFNLKLEKFNSYLSRPNKCFDCERMMPNHYGTSSKCFSCEKQIGYHGGNTKCFSCMKKVKCVKPKKCIMCERNKIINRA